MSAMQRVGALGRRRVRHFDVGGYVGPDAPGFTVGPYGAPEFAPGGMPAGGTQAPGALGTSLGGGGTGAVQAGGSPSGSGIAGLGISARDIATTAGSVALGALGTALAGPFGGIAGSLGGKYGVGAIYDALSPPTPLSMAPAPQMQPMAEPTAAAGAGIGAGDTLGGAMSNVGGVSTADPGSMGDITSARRGGHIHRQGALARRMRTRK